MGYKPLAIGVSDFAEMIETGSYYVDKTLMIRELLDNTAKVTLFTRPRRFGKTLNISMLRYFFEDDRTPNGGKRDRAYLFEGLKIADAGEKYLAHMGQYPVICLSFKDAKRGNFEESYRQIAQAVSYELKRHAFILESQALSTEKQKYEEMMKGQADRQDYEKSILFLSQCLETYYGKKPVVLMDEYDVPLEHSFTGGFYDEMTGFIRALFESGLKDNTSLGFAVITGCLRISRESIFTGLNHLNIVSVLSVNFEEYFGFTAGEVEEICRHYDMVDQYATIREWYDGYTFGQTDIYNPWSVIKYIYDALPAHNWLPRSYWANTSSNQIVRTLIDHADDMERARLEALMAGETVTIQVHEDITNDEIFDGKDNLWNFMFFTGYFRKIREWQEEDGIYMELAIPNREVKYIFSQKIEKWFQDKLKGRDMQPLFHAVLAKDCAVVTEELNSIFCETISHMDQNEFYYHGMMAGLLTGLKGLWSVPTGRAERVAATCC